MVNIHIQGSETIQAIYCKRGYFRWGKISWKSWQDISRGGNFHDTTPISFIKAYVFYFCVGLIFREEYKSAENAKISTFTVYRLNAHLPCLRVTG